MNVILYSVSNCPFCTEMRDFLKSEGISFKEVDLAKTTKEDAIGLIDKIPADSDLAVPMIDIDGQLLYGAGPENKDFIKCKVKGDGEACNRV